MITRSSTSTVFASAKPCDSGGLLARVTTSNAYAFESVALYSSLSHRVWKRPEAGLSLVPLAIAPGWQIDQSGSPIWLAAPPTTTNRSPDPIDNRGSARKT